MERCYADYATRSIADLSPFENGMILNRINVPKAHRGKGHARELLGRVLTDADACGMTLYLWISPSDGLNHEQLESWYHRHGFKFWKKATYRRAPRSI